MFRNGPEDIQCASDCLQLYIARVHSDHRTRQLIRAKICEDSPGSSALSWLFAHHRPDPTAFHFDYMFTRAMFHCLIAERQDKLIWQKLSLPDDAFPGLSPNPPHTRKWKSGFMLEFVVSQSYWADAERPFDDSLRSFLRGWDDHGIPVRAARYWLETTVPAAWLPVDTSLYDQFASKLRSLRSISTLEKYWRGGKVNMGHPSTPSVDRLWDFFSAWRDNNQLYEQSQFAQHVCEATEGGLCAALRSQLLHTARSLRRAGQHERSRALLDIGTNLRPDLLAKVHWETVARSDSVKPWRWRPMPSEAARGVTLDKDGFLQSDNSYGCRAPRISNR